MSLMNSLMSSSGARRMLIYLLVDTSGSMHGAPIHAVREGIDFLIRNLKKTPEAVEMVHISVVSFNSSAQEEVPLSPLFQFSPPALQCTGGTDMAAGLNLVNKLIDRDFVPNQGGELRGDYKPMIFLLTDGMPNNVEEAVRAGETLKNRPSGKTVGTFLALGCGPHVQADTLKRVAKNVAMMENMTDENLEKFFQWVTASIATASRAASRPAGEAGGESAAPEVPKNSDGDAAFKFEF